MRIVIWIPYRLVASHGSRGVQPHVVVILAGPGVFSSGGQYSIQIYSHVLFEYIGLYPAGKYSWQFTSPLYLLYEPELVTRRFLIVERKILSGVLPRMLRPARVPE